MPQYFLCHAGTTIEQIVSLRLSGRDIVEGKIYEWRGEYVREPCDDDKAIEMVVYELFTGRRFIASQHHLTPIDVPESVTRERRLSQCPF